MFGVLFGWRKASKCKKVINEAQCRLKLLKKKRHSIVKHLREDTANLIKLGHQAIALDRAEQLIKDESVAVAYELIDNFCDFIRTHFAYIRRHKGFRDDINEAVSSLIYASARCGDLPELRVIRSLFEERYGHKIATAAVELFPGNLVNQQIIEALNTKFVSDDMKHRMVNEIATDYCLQIQPLALEYRPNWRNEVKQSNDDSLVVLTDARSSVEEARVSTAESEVRIVVDLARDSERIVGASSSESLPRYSEEMLVVCLDDVVELPPSKDEDSKDQRVFKFKTPTLSKRESFRNGSDQRIESWSENVSSNSPQSGRDSSRRRVRRRLVYTESQGFEDAESTSYYAHKPRGYSRSFQRRKQQKKSQAEEVIPFTSNEGNECEIPRPRQENMMPWSCDRRICRKSNDQKGVEDRGCVDSYLRTETMPLERSKEVSKDEFPRSNSLPVREHPNHVHPKLPDYDDLTATFMAMKREFLMNNKVQ